jgi:hypothetical protein
LLRALALLSACICARAGESDDGLRWIGTISHSVTKHFTEHDTRYCDFHKSDMTYEQQDDYLLESKSYVVLREEANPRHAEAAGLVLERGECTWRVSESLSTESRCSGGVAYERGRFTRAGTVGLTEEHGSGFITSDPTGRRTYWVGLSPEKTVRGTIVMSWRKHLPSRGSPASGTRRDGRSYRVPGGSAGGPRMPSVEEPGFHMGIKLGERRWGPFYLSDDGSRMSGSYQEDGKETKRVPVRGTQTATLDARFRWNLTRMGNVVVEIESCARNWRPDPREEEGVPASIRARIVKPRGAKGFMRFTLFDVSREPGYCMNAGTGNHPDLEFVYDGTRFTNARWERDASGKWIEVMETKEPVNEVTVQVKPLDFGAYGCLKAEAGLSAMWHPARASHGSQYYVTIPLDEDGNRIADGLAIANQDGEAADADNDSWPEGDRQPGDGLTHYEEYRGFEIKGKWRMTDPDEKDLFICYGEAVAGLHHRIFENATELTVHEISEDEFNGSDSRVVNFNHGTAHLVDQHGLYIIPSVSDMDSAGGVYPLEVAKESPRDTERVEINVAFHHGLGIRALMPLTLAHELGHAVSIEHHGPADVTVTRAELDRTPDFADKGELMRYLDKLRVSASCKMARYNGLHSGNEKCFMRYYEGPQVYKRDDGTIYPYPQDDEVGTELCDSARGTGINRDSRREVRMFKISGRSYPFPVVFPMSGDAARGRGACKKQIRVSDCVR